MPDYMTVAKIGEIPDGRGVAFQVGNKMVAVFNDGGKYYAIDDCCPHMGASLAEGILEEGTVACPWHDWRFSVHDGTWCDYRRIKIDRFDVRLQGDEIQVRMPEEDDSAAGTETT